MVFGFVGLKMPIHLLGDLAIFSISSIILLEL